MKKKWYRKNSGLVGGLFALVFFISILLPAAVDAQAQYAEDWKYLVGRDYVNVVAIYEGTVWQGINGGLVARSLYGPEASRYYNKLNSDLNAMQVLAVTVDKYGNVWVGTENGAFRRAVDGSWNTYNRDNSPLTVNTVRAVVPDDAGGVWFGTWLGGAYYLDSEQEWTVYNTGTSGIPGNRIYAIAPDGEGGVWFGTDTRGAAYLDSEGEWTVYRTANSPLTTNDIQDILIDDTGRVWFATMSGLVCLDREAVLDDEESQWMVFDLENSEIPSEIVNSLVQGEKGNLWLGTNNGIACLLDVAEGGTWEVFTVEDSLLPAPVVRGIDIDISGTVWAGTWGGGIAGYNPSNNTWRVYGQDTVTLHGKIELPSNTVNRILPFPEGDDTGKVWFATSAGVAGYDSASKKWEILDTDNRFPVNNINGIARDRQGNMAFATDGGGLAVKNTFGVWQYYNQENSEIPSDTVADVAYDADGGIWLVLVRGKAAHLAANGNWTVYDPAADDVPSGTFNSVYCDDAGNVWFGTWGGGAVRLNSEGEWTVYKARDSGLPANDISRIIAENNGNIWFGTWGGGVAMLDNAGSWEVFNRENSALRSNIIRDIVIDSRGWTWVATPHGAAYYDGEQWHALRALESGLPVNSIWNLAVDDLGNVWFSTSEIGVAAYNPDGVVAALDRFTDITEKELDAIIFYEGEYLESDVSPVMANNRLLVPMRPMATALGADLSWDEQAGRVLMTLDEKTVELTIDDANATIDGETFTLDVPASLRQGRTMVPVRFVSEGLGLDVTWDPVVRAAFLRVQ